MRHLTAILLALLVLVSCGNRNGKKAETNEMIYNGEIGYADIVSFIVQGYQSQWNEVSPFDQGLSLVYLSCAPDYGYAETDINGDGVNELLIGSNDEDGTYRIFDIWTINHKDGSLSHLASGDDRDWFVINGDGVIIESSVNIYCSSPIRKGWQIEDAKRVKMKGDAWHDILMKVIFEKFSDLMPEESVRKCYVGEFTSVRKPSDEEVAMLKNATDDDGMIIYTPLYVSSQIVAGTNYRFWCICDDLGAELKDFKEPTKTYGYCWVTVFKPLPGQGEPKVTDITMIPNASHTYAYEGDGFGGKFTVTLKDDGTFTWYEGPLSSYIGYGKWTRNGSMIKTVCQEDGKTNIFRIEEGGLSWVEDGSDNFPYIKVMDGAVFSKEH